jgi:Zn-dependent protease
MAWLPNKDNRNGSNGSGNNGSGNGRDNNVYNFPPKRPRQQQEWPISPSFLGLVAAFLIVGAIMYATPQFARGAVFPFVVAGWLITLCLHEFGHAYTAYRFGDYTVREKGYLTLDPIKYADPVTSILFPVLILAIGGLGLPGGAVYIQKHLFREKWEMSACSAAGPAFDFVSLMAIVAILTLFAGPLASAPILKASLVLLAMLQTSSILFNLLPVPGFDGWGIIEPYLPRDIQESAMRVGPLAALGLIAVFLFVPGVASAFWGVIFSIMKLFGLELNEAFRAFRMFQFWK